MKRTSTIFINFIASVILPFVISAHSASTGEDETKTQFEKEGFIFIGQMSPDKIPNSSNKTTGKLEGIWYNYNLHASTSGINGISLFASQPSDKVTQAMAEHKCRDLSGDLLFIINNRQFENVRLFTRSIGGGPFWTSACYDERIGNFAYFRGGVMIPVVSQHLKREYTCQRKTSNYGLTIQGSLSSYGLCSASSSSAHLSIYYSILS